MPLVWGDLGGVRQDARVLCVPAALFHKLRADHDAFRRFFDRSRADSPRPFDLTNVRVETLMVASPVTCAPDLSIQDAAHLMHDRRISCLCVCEDGKLTSIVTLRDLSGKALARGLPHDTPVSAVMTPDPHVLPPSAIGSDVLHMMMEHRLGHLPTSSWGMIWSVSSPRPI